MIEEVRGDCPDLRDVVLIGTESWEALLARADEVPAEQVAQVQSGLDPHDPINIQYTSGTTGFPKGATLSHRNILNNGFFVGELCRYTEADRVCIPVPFYHCFGMVMGNLACDHSRGGDGHPGAGLRPGRDAQGDGQDERCTSLYGVPTMFIAEWALPDFAQPTTCPRVRTGIMAGSPCPADDDDEAHRLPGITEMTICYGMTETSPVSTQTRTDDTFERRSAPSARVGPHLEIKVVDPRERARRCRAGRPASSAPRATP